MLSSSEVLREIPSSTPYCRLVYRQGDKAENISTDFKNLDNRVFYVVKDLKFEFQTLIYLSLSSFCDL